MEVLDDDHLNTFLCSICHKYLSLFPVKNHRSRDVTCGRCAILDDDGVRSLYELVAKEYLFRCVNRYEGCRKLLRVEEVGAHERNCVGNLFKCPKCEGEPPKSILELIWHYKHKHPTSVLRKNSFEGILPVKDAMLYIQDEVISFILIQYDFSSNTLHLSAAILTAAEGMQTFLVSEGSDFKSTERKVCKPLNAESYNDCFKLHVNSIQYVRIIFILELKKIARPTVSQLDNKRNVGVRNAQKITANNDQKLKDDEVKQEATSNSPPPLSYPPRGRRQRGGGVTRKQHRGPSDTRWPGHLRGPPATYFIPRLSENFKGLYSKYNLNGTEIVSKDGKKRFDLTCSNCKNVISKYIYVCWEMDHYICRECRIWCGICECPIEYMCKTEPIYRMIDLIKFSCKFRCGEFFFNHELYPHEYNCKKNIVQCPKCLLDYQFSSIYSHLITDHKVGFSLFFNFSNLKESINTRKTAHYFMLHRKWFCVKWCKNDEDNSNYDLTFEPLKDIQNAKFGLVVNKKHCVYTFHYNNVRIHNNRFCLEPFLSFN